MFIRAFIIIYARYIDQNLSTFGCEYVSWASPCWCDMSNRFPCTLPPAPWAEIPNGHLGASLDGHRSVCFPCILLLRSWLHHTLSSRTHQGQQLWVFPFLTQLLFSAPCCSSMSSPCLQNEAELMKHRLSFSCVVSACKFTSVKHDYFEVSLGSAGGSSSPPSFRCLKIM